MGLTPLAGLMMGSRSGDIDASAVTYIMEKLGLKPQEMADYLNKKSGVLGITGISSDMRDIESAAKEGNERAQLALKMYDYRIKKYIGAYTAALGGVDAVVFTAGVGENQTSTREKSCEGLEYLGIKIDVAKNATVHGEEAIISTPDSKVKVVVVPTDEEIVIARDTKALVEKAK
jgi:acetate kinase